jgi:F-type H+-transporting ATPase subunit epsilon
MTKLFNLKLITPDKTVYENKVVSLIVPAALGYLGVLANHAPLVANLVSGIIFHSQSKGFLQVLRNEARIILHNAIPASTNISNN